MVRYGTDKNTGVKFRWPILKPNRSHTQAYVSKVIMYFSPMYFVAKTKFSFVSWCIVSCNERSYGSIYIEMTCNFTPVPIYGCRLLRF